DITETKEGNDDFTPYVQSIGSSLIMKVWRYQVDCTNIKTDPLFICINDTSSYTGSLFELLIDITEDIRRSYGITEDSTEGCALQMGYMYTLRTWCGYKDQSFLLNLYTQYMLRNYIGGLLLCRELFFLLEGIQIPKRVRGNIFWDRCYEIFAFLPVRSNDIIGVEKEWRQMMTLGKPIDNVIFHYMVASNCSFEEAVSRAIRKHNLALKEFHDILRFFNNNKGSLIDLNETEKSVFEKSTSIMAESLACHIRGQTLMFRYKAGLQLTFEKRDIVEHMSLEI
ncbi:unnamed protein product, partial [Allacma fusca]